MFLSFQFINYKKENFNFKLIDSSFETNVVVEFGAYILFAIGVIKEYRKRNLDVTKNLVLFNLYLEKEHGIAMINITYYQDIYCPKYFSDWVSIANRRDQLINKLSAMK